MIQNLGVQEAARKRRPPSLGAEAGARCVVKTNNCVDNNVTQAKWQKAKDLLKDLRSSIGSPDHPGSLVHKSLERSRGYFDHLGTTCPVVLPYLRGCHNTRDSWRNDRDFEG